MFSLSDYDLRLVATADVLDLRTAILLRHRADSSPSVAGDGHPYACHVAVFHDEAKIGVGSIHPEPMPEGYRTGAWRLHGLAIEHGHRGMGVGALIVERCLEHAASQEARAVWAIAPAGAFGFFERYGFRRTGDPIDDQDGPQYMLFAELGPLRRSWSI